MTDANRTVTSPIDAVLASLPDDVEAAVSGRPPTAAWPGAEAAEQMLLAAQVDELAAIDDRLRALRDDQFMEFDQRFVDDADQLAQQLRAARRQVAAADAQDDFQAAEIQQFLNDRDRALARQIIDQQLAEDAQIDFLEQQRARLLLAVQQHYLEASGKLYDPTVPDDGRSAGDGLGFSEFAGPCFSPNGEWLFVNIQVPGITCAITGDWGSIGL